MDLNRFGTDSWHRTTFAKPVHGSFALGDKERQGKEILTRLSLHINEENLILIVKYRYLPVFEVS